LGNIKRGRGGVSTRSVTYQENITSTSRKTGRGNRRLWRIDDRTKSMKRLNGTQVKLADFRESARKRVGAMGGGKRSVPKRRGALAPRYFFTTWISQKKTPPSTKGAGRDSQKKRGEENGPRTPWFTSRPGYCALEEGMSRNVPWTSPCGFLKRTGKERCRVRGRTSENVAGTQVESACGTGGEIRKAKLGGITTS